MKIDPNAPAFPHHVYPQHSGPGLTIRAYFAGMAMQGFMSYWGHLSTENEFPFDDAAADAVVAADSLIAALNAEDKG